MLIFSNKARKRGAETRRPSRASFKKKKSESESESEKERRQRLIFQKIMKAAAAPPVCLDACFEQSTYSLGAIRVEDSHNQNLQIISNSLTNADLINTGLFTPDTQRSGVFESQIPTRRFASTLRFKDHEKGKKTKRKGAVGDRKKSTGKSSQLTTARRPPPAESQLSASTSTFSSQFVEDMRKVHRTQIEGLEQEYRRAVDEHGRVKADLLRKLEWVEAEMNRRFKEHSQEMDKICLENIEIRSGITERAEGKIHELEERLAQRNQEIDKERQASRAANEELAILRADYSELTSRFELEQKYLRDNLEKERAERRERVEQLNARNVSELESIKQDYEGLLKKQETGYQRRIDDLSRVSHERGREGDQLRAELSEVRGELGARVGLLQHSLAELKESGEAGKRLEEVLRLQNEKLKRESRLYCSEVEHLEKENDRQMQENEELKSAVVRLEKLVYGKKKPTTTPQKAGRF